MKILSSYQYFQQDGAPPPPHYALLVRQFLDEQVEGRWIGRHGGIEWRAQTPDLNHLDFFFYGAI